MPAKEQNPVEAGIQELGEPSSFACPECHGVLHKIMEGGILRFRCHIGHAYSAATLVAAIDQGIEIAMWTTVRALEEAQILFQQLADHVRLHDEDAALDFEQQSADAGADAETVRQITMNRQTLDTSNVTSQPDPASNARR